MKTLNYTFELENILTDENGVAQYDDEGNFKTEVLEKKATFRMIGRSLAVFEQTFGKPLLSVLGRMGQANEGEEFDMISDSFLISLARATYVDVSHPMDVDAGAIKFDEEGIAEFVAGDINFLQEIMMLIHDFMDKKETSKKVSTRGTKKAKK